MPRRGSIEPVDGSTFTDCMELLQEAYVSAVVATAGCSVTFVKHDTFLKDALIVRPGWDGGEEVSLYAQLKSSTTLKPDPSKPTFGYKFTKRRYMEDLVKPRSVVKAILLVMTTHRVQGNWTIASHHELRLHHCCYWKSLEGDTVPAGVQSPTTGVSTSAIFDAPALTEIMDRLDRREGLR